MAGNSIWCFLQGVDESFPVNVKGIETIKDLRDLVLCQQKKFIRNINVDKYNIFQISIPIDDIAEFGKLRQNPIEIERVKLEDSQEISAILETNDTHIQVFIGKVIPPTLNEILEKTVSTPIHELTVKIQELAVQIQNKKTRNSQQLSDLCIMGIRVNDKLVFEKKYQHIVHVRREFRVKTINFVRENNKKKWKPSVESIDDQPHIEWTGDHLSELEKRIISTDAKPRLIDLYNQAVQNNNEQEIEKILDKFSLNRTNDIGEQIDQMQGSQWSNLDSHKNFTVFRGDNNAFIEKVDDMIKYYLR